MTHLAAEAVIPLPAAEFWAIRNSPEFYEIECEVLGNESKALLDEQYNAEGLPVRARLATKPDISFVPQYLRNMLPTPDKTIIFYDEIEYIYDDPLTPYAFKCRTVPNVFAERADIQGYVRIIPNPDGRTCTQTITVDVHLNAWGVATIVGTLIGRGVTDGYSKLPLMVEKWKSIATGAFLREAEAASVGNNEPLPVWGSIKHSWHSGHSEDEFFDADDSGSDEELVGVVSGVSRGSSTDADDVDSGVAHTDTMSEVELEATDTGISGQTSAENLLISHQPGMGDDADGQEIRGRMGVDLPEEQQTAWGLCGLGGFSIGSWW